MNEQEAKKIFIESSYGSAIYTKEELIQSQEIMFNKIKKTLPKKSLEVNSSIAPNFIHSLDSSFPSN